ncbi:TlpA family protein disulfide reductase [Sphingobacterium sp. UBA6645]|uniref:TlpA family protein disulfide reductase n=1 Tax=Sphingobacterium sp. UBA6645 TaxID=1947511 RepID=UPI0025FDC285|nr:TlpA disulfide reductase family protein [Sphingobacterium sp. UBA6645]
MRKIVLTVVAAFMLLTAQAQQNTAAKDMRQRFTELNNIQDEKLLAEQLKSLLQGTAEEDYLLVYYFYSNKGEETKAEEVKQVITQKFPEGQLVFQEKLQAIDALTDLEVKATQFDALYAKYPNQSYGYTAYSLAQEFAAKGDETKMKHYADIYASKVTDGRGNAIRKEAIYANVAGALVNVNPDAAAPYLKEGVEEAKRGLDEQLADTAADPNRVLRARNNYYGLLVGYINALTAGSNPEAGYTLAKQTVDGLKATGNTEEGLLSYLESSYLQSLMATKRFSEALPLMEKAVKEGKASDNVKENLQIAYEVVKGSSSGFRQYEQELYVAQEAYLQEEVAKMAINQPAHHFELKDVDGKTVKLSDLKGKVVVLDFWATWCGPCKASFPAMQKAVNKYKEDPKVEFLFLHTWEKGSGDATQNAKKYIVDNSYTFEVLMDLRDPETKQSAVASAYQVEGIPTKIIIDPKGNIRFNTSGFSADADKAVKELSTMIEFAKKG